jgi:hypothetical protein
MISCYVDKRQDNWDRLLPMLTFAYNSAQHRVTKYSTFETLYGRKPRIVFDLLTDEKEEDIDQATVDINERWMSDLRENMRLVHDIVASNRDVAMNRANIDYDRRARPKEYAVGDLILLDNVQVKKGLSKKLAHKWQGPYIVTDKISELNYRVKERRARGRSKIVHVNSMKKYFEEEVVCQPPLAGTLHHNA